MNSFHYRDDFIQSTTLSVHVDWRNILGPKSYTDGYSTSKPREFCISGQAIDRAALAEKHILFPDCPKSWHLYINGWDKENLTCCPCNEMLP